MAMTPTQVYLVTKSCPPEGADVVAVAMTPGDARDAVEVWAKGSPGGLPLKPLHGKDRWETADGFWEVEITGWRPHVKRKAKPKA
jgi:hypothetical protein